MFFMKVLLFVPLIFDINSKLKRMNRIILLVLVFFCVQLNAQVDIQNLLEYSDSILNKSIDDSQAPGVVIGIATSDSIVMLKGYGYSDFDNKVRVNPESTLFQIGSVGKLFTSIALLQQVEIGRIGLDDDVNKLLDGWKIRNPFPKVVTPFDLLTHTAGFNDQNINYLVKNNSEVESLDIHLPKNMPSVFIEPGTEINYSNYSYALAGHLVELVSGNAFEDQIQASIFHPLQMSSATYYLPDNYEDKVQFAKGYKTREVFQKTKMYPRHAKPAGSVVASGKDMISFAQALLKRDSSILKNSSYDLLLNQQFTNHPKLTGYTMGLEVQTYNGHTTFAKGGKVLGFLSVLLLFPELDLTIFLSTNTQTDNHFESYIVGLKNELFKQEKVDTVTLSFDIEEYAGEYANKRANHETIEEFFALFMNHFTIYESKSGNLTAYHNGEWHEYQYLGDDVFQDLSTADGYITFKRNKGNINTMYRTVNIGGVQVPASYTKLRWTERPRFLNDEYPYALVVMMSYMLIPFLWLVRYFIRKKKPKFLQSSSIPFYYHGVAFMFLGLFLWNIVGLMIPIVNLKEQMMFGLPESLMKMRYFNWLMAVNSIILVLFSLQLWLKGKSTMLFRAYYTIFSLIALSYILILYRWHFLNVSI